MCGRFTLRTPMHILMERFQLSAVPEMGPRFNIAPTQPVPVVRLDPERGERELTFLHWGLVPSWADDIRIGNRMINARAESVSSKPAFRAAFKRRRCLVVADGYYEWKKQGSKKQPFLIEMPDGEPFAMAGLWESWHGHAAGSAAGSGDLQSCTIITTDANDQTRTVHDRMPVLLPESAWNVWLDRSTDDVDRLNALLQPWQESEMRLTPVSTRVNNPRHEGADCVAGITGSADRD